MKNNALATGRAVLVAFLCFVSPSSFAGEGWYLLIPPTSDYDESAKFLSSYKILDSQSLSKWTQQAAYDSAAECEAVKNSLLMAEYNAYSKQSADYINAVGANKNLALLKHMRWTTERSNANVNALSASRCIKSDDARWGKLSVTN